jgi:hypothetical protein
VSNANAGEEAGAGDWAAIEAQLCSNWREMAVEHGINPAAAQASAKIRDLAVLLRLVFFHVGTNSSLATTTAMASAANLVSLSHVALHKWMCRLGPYFEALLAATTDVVASFAAEKWAGFEILVVDATTVLRPNAPGTTARVHYAMRLSDLRHVHVEVTDDKGGETFRRFARMARRMQLWIGDRGYSNPPGIAAIVARGADVLVRVNRWSLPLFDAQDQQIHLPTWLRDTDPGVPLERAAWVRARGHEPILGRLCAVRLPPEKAEEAKQRLRSSKTREATADMLEMAEFVVVFMTVPASVFSTRLVLELYQLRWQLELSIKRDKSIAGLDRLPNFRPDTIRTWMLAKMLLVQIAHKISMAEIAVPPSALAA